MLLRVYGESKIQIINLNASFFNNYENRRGGKTQIITPKEKALQLGKQLFGNAYRGHILEFDGEIIQNTVEDNKGSVDLEKAVTRGTLGRTAKSSRTPQGVGHLAGKLNQALK